MSLPSLHSHEYEKLVCFDSENIFTLNSQVAAASNITTVPHQELFLLIAFSGFPSM